MLCFHRTLRRILLGSLATASAACSSGLDKDGLEPVACSPSNEPLVGVTSAPPADYVELRSWREGSPAETKQTRGVLCATAADKPKCESDYRAVEITESDRPLLEPGGQIITRQIVIITDAQGVKVLRSRETLKAWLLPVDTREEAVFAAQLEGYTVECGNLDSGGVGGDGPFRVFATKMTSDCDPVETKNFILEVDSSGEVKEIESEVKSSQAGVCIGRRPEGLVSHRSRAKDPVGRWLAEVAYLEAASVASFERLASELERFGAPEALVTKARAAARDETRHAASMKALAERYGAAVLAPRPLSFDERGLEAFAIENAVEGCVFESFGALVGLAQAEVADDPTVRGAMRGVARDECRHGELAWEIDAWLSSQLDGAASARVKEARREAARALVEDHVDALDVASARVLGVPVGDARRHLAERFVANLDVFARGAHEARAA